MNEKRRAYQQQYRDKYKAQAKRVNLTLSNDEYRAFLRAAERQGVKPSSYIKTMAVAGFQKQASIPTNLEEELKTLRFAIRNIANNVNQLTHYSHTVRAMSTADENNLFQHLKQLEDAVQQYTEGKLSGEGDDH